MVNVCNKMAALEMENNELKDSLAQLRIRFNFLLSIKGTREDDVKGPELERELYIQAQIQHKEANELRVTLEKEKQLVILQIELGIVADNCNAPVFRRQRPGTQQHEYYCGKCYRACSQPMDNVIY